MKACTDNQITSDTVIDDDALEELFRDAYPKLAGWIGRTVDEHTAHEIASEAFVRLLSRRVPVERPRSYLYAIAANLIRDHWRKTEREQRAFRSVTAGTATDQVSYPMQDVDVRQLIAALPPRLRDPFLLHYYGALGIREVAALLGKAEGSIKADLFAARGQLKMTLVQGGQRPGRYGAFTKPQAVPARDGEGDYGGVAVDPDGLGPQGCGPRGCCVQGEYAVGIRCRSASRPQ
ncbi:MAG TPA: RNA polymerase sigma factor [Trebonia sp.]|jgi:RNA polymerase sigma-70 factor (ECF subfamily)|nr:RNA polymerase sigma factor [Trebonia sp.]